MVKMWEYRGRLTVVETQKRPRRKKQGAAPRASSGKKGRNKKTKGQLRGRAS